MVLKIGLVEPTPRASTEDGLPDTFSAGVSAREQFRRIYEAQNEIFRDAVLYSPPDAQPSLERLLQERDGPILAAAREYRAWLAANPEGHARNPNS